MNIYNFIIDATGKIYCAECVGDSLYIDPMAEMFRDATRDGYVCNKGHFISSRALRAGVLCDQTA